MKQEKLIKSCSSLLYKLCNLVESCNSLNFYDINISSESFFIPILNMIYDCDLQNINIENKNAAAIDLGDKNGKLAVQVTSDSSAKKIHNTLKKYREYRLYKQYDRLIILVIKKKRSDCTDYSQDIKGEFNFSKKDDIIAIDSLVQNIRDLSIEKINSIHEYLEFSLESRLDNTQVLSIEQEFDDISQNTDNILNESFFEIDHDVFIADFREKLSSSEIIHVSSLSIEEGKFCILNLLHKICPDTHVYTIKSKDTWDKAKEYLEGCILIPYFTAAEIPAIKNNKTIIIHTSDYCAGSIIESLHKNHFADEFYIAFLSTLQLDRKTIGCIQNLPKEAEQKYWSLFSRIPNGDEDLINYVIENLLKNQNWNQLLFILYKKAEIFNTEDIITAVSNCVEKKISDHEKISHNECFYIEELLKKVYQKIGNDFESYPQLFEIEKILLGYSHIEWTNMKCSQYLFKRNANYYADILEKIIYYSNQKDEKFQSRLLYYLNLKREAEFCPGEENGSINEVILNEWIKTFYYRLKKQGQERHFQDILGNLFSFSPIGKDGLFPHESIREKIEEIGDDDMIRSFAISVLCSRGAYWATEGKDEYKLAQKYKQLSKAFEIYYPKTSKAFNILSSHYMGESERERRNAENYMF